MREQSPRAAGLLCFDNEVFRTSQHKDRACGHLINRWILALPLFHPLKHWGINFQNDPSDSHLLGPHPLSHVGQRQLESPGGCAGRMRCDSQTWVIQGPVASSLLSLGALLWENQPCHWVGTLNKSWGEVPWGKGACHPQPAHLANDVGGPLGKSIFQPQSSLQTM